MRGGLSGGSKAELRGEVRFDRFTRGRYATDASHYQMMPLGVVLPGTIRDAERALAIARAEGVERAGARRRHLAGRPGRSMRRWVIDCSSNDQVIELDVPGRRLCRRARHRA